MDMIVTGLAIGFGILAVLLGLILRKLIWQIRDLERQISFLEEKQSNGDVVCDIRFGGIGGLTDTLNRVFEQQKSRRQQWIRNENRIAQTYTNTVNVSGRLLSASDTDGRSGGTAKISADHTGEDSCSAGYSGGAVYVYQTGEPDV